MKVFWGVDFDVCLVGLDLLSERDLFWSHRFGVRFAIVDGSRKFRFGGPAVCDHLGFVLCFVLVSKAGRVVERAVIIFVFENRLDLEIRIAISIRVFE